MQYLSTRDSALRVSAQEAIVRGLAPQSGLFVPIDHMKEVLNIRYDD